MAYKIDLYYRDKAITFGPRFKGEVGKDIFAVKVALGLLTPISESDQDTISYDPGIPFDQQRWFDCSSGVGVDIVKATKFDTTLENALLTYQVNNKFLITAYYFEKFGIKNLLEKVIKDNGETIYEAEIATQMNASMTLFEGELRTLGEATIAVMHGWRPASTIKNNSYTHDAEIYEQRVDDVIPRGLYEEIIDPLYPQNLSILEEQEIVIPDSASPDLIEGRFSSTRNWWNRLTDPSLSTASISYYPMHSGNSPLFVATTKIIDYYLENNLFSQTISQEELTRQARRALYPDPFSSTETFIIDGTTLGLYMETDFFLQAEGPLPNEEFETIALLEEKALIKALRDSGKPQVWNFLKDEQSFRGVYFSSQDPIFEPDHSGVYPINITTEMLEQLVEVYPDQNVDPRSDQFIGFKIDNYWVLSTSDVTGNLEEGDRSIQYWRILENIGGTEPLIKFKEFITPSLRPGQSYRALFEINRQKFDLITNGDNLFEFEEDAEETVNDQPTDQDACLNQSAEQTLRTYEEYRAHAIKKRRDLVRKIREEIQRKSRDNSTIDLGVFDSSLSGLNIDSYTDYQLVQSLAQLLPGQELAEIIVSAGGGAIDDSLTWLQNNVAEGSGKTANPDVDNYTAAFSHEEFKERIEKASKDLRESAEVIRRERIRLTPESQFDGNSEASFLSSIPAEIQSAYSSAKGGNKLPDKSEIIFTFKESEYTGAGFKNGKVLLSVIIENNGDRTRIFGDQKKQPDALRRPRTVNYISQLKDMTFFPKLSSFFDDSRNSCKDLGINLDKITGYAYVTKYTSGLNVIVDPGEGSFSFKSWWEQEVEDPIIRFGQQSRDNLKASWDSSNFDQDAALRALGADCTAEKIWGEIFDRLDPVSLICDYIKCLKLPPFDIKFPDFNIDPIPKIGIIGWYKGLIEFLINNMRQIIERLACTIGRMIIDKLAFPFCEEQLNDFITSGLESTQPFVKQALVDSLIRTGVSDNNKAKTFFDSAVNILTGRELCYILAGNMPDNATMTAIQRLAESSGVDAELTTPEEIINFFGVIGVYMPEEICEQLNSRTIVQPTQCDSTNDLLRSIRNRLQSSDSSLSESEINNAVALAEKNKQEEADRVKAFLENGFSGLVPPVFDYGNPSAPMSDFPEFLKKEQEKSAQNLFSSAKASYAQGLQEYVPAMYITTPMNLWPYDERYDQVQVLRIEAALQQIKNYGKAAERVGDGEIPALLDHYAELHELYQVEIIKDLPQDLVPEDFRPDLFITPGTSNTQTPRYRLPHVTTLSMNSAGDINQQGVLVHKRMIARPNAVTEQDIRDEITSLDVVINRYTKRVSRTSGKKRNRLRDERRPFIRRKNTLLEKLDSEEYDTPEIVDYEFFMAYQKNINKEEFQALRLEFDLVPHDDSIFSFSIEHSNFLPLDAPAVLGFEDASGPFLDTARFSRAGQSDFGIGDDNPRATSEVIRAIKDRIMELNNRISEILQARPQITDDSLFPGLQEMLDQQTESTLEKINRETVTADGSGFEIKFNAGAIYSPSITLSEKTEYGDKDRFDIIVKGDFFTGLGQDGVRTFKYCNKLPDVYTDPELPPLQQSNSYAKRFRFRNAIADSLKEIDFEFEFRSQATMFMASNFFKSTTESLIETLLDELGDSYLFDAYQVEMLDNRLSGKRQINNSCVSNRFSLGDGSVAAFNKVIMGDIASEIAKEMMKPENSPENYDFDTIPAFDLAMQNLSLKAYVRVCLIDLLLKGGLAYSIWDIEPIIGERFFIDYAISHVKSELESSDELKEPWGKIIERVTGINNKNIALETLVKEELIKIPNYSKQIFHPQEQKSNFYNWFLDNHMPQVQMASRGDIDNGKPMIAERPVPGQEDVFFLAGKQKFIIEHYIRINGPNLVREFKQSLENISGIQGEEVQTGEYFLDLSIGDFISAKSRLENPNEVKRLLNNTQETISQASRVVLVDPVTYFAQDTAFQAFDPNAPEEEPEEVERNRFVETILAGEDDEGTLSEKSIENKSYWVNVRYSNDESVDIANAFAIPFFFTTRVLDFDDCYSFDDYSKDEFNEALGFMVDKLSEEKEFEMMFEHIFPIRRLMSLCSVFTTSVVSGYNSMPTIMIPVKAALASITKTMGTSRNARAELVTISQEELLKQLTENFPTSEDACIDWPPGIGNFYEMFFKELMRLIRKMPSIILRGIANQLDPAYKEMRQHYLNCDIKHLTYRGLKPAGTGLYKLTNGLYLDGRTPLAVREDVGGLQGRNRGKYVPLVTGVLSDAGMAFWSLPSFAEFGLRLGLMTSKLVSYIYSGNKPFLDPSFYFKFPCMDIDEGAWRDYGKYDAGLYGRYGHPLSPFTLLALSTPQLESDKRIKDNNCIEEEKLEAPDCVPGEPVVLMPEKQRDDAGSVVPSDPYAGLLPPGASPPSQEVLQRQQEAIDAERAELAEYSDWYNSMTPEQQQEILLAEIAEGEDPSAVSNEADCDAPRKAIRIAINTLRRVSQSLLSDPNGLMAQSYRFQMNNLTTEIKTLKQGLVLAGCRGTPIDGNANKTKDVVTARFFREGETTPFYTKQVEIPWRISYVNNQIDGFFDFTNSTDYNNFGN